MGRRGFLKLLGVGAAAYAIENSIGCLRYVLPVNESPKSSVTVEPTPTPTPTETPVVLPDSCFLKGKLPVHEDVCVVLHQHKKGD